MLVVLAAIGGGTYFFRTVQENKRLELQAQQQQAKLKSKEAEAKARAEEAKSKDADARKAENARKAAEAEAAKKKDALAQSKQEAENLKLKAEAAKAAAQKAESERKAAEAATKKSEAAKAAADAELAVQKQKTEAEAVALKRAQTERAKAEAEFATTAAAKRIAEAALAKSENELKTAEANATAERDRKLRMYSRANTSRAEMLALQRAEKLLALEESGALAAAGTETENAADATKQTSAESSVEAKGETNAVVAVKWPEAVVGETPAGARIEEVMCRVAEKTQTARVRRARAHINSFSALIDKASAEEGRETDVAYYRRTLVSLVPDYVDVYMELISEARASGDAKAESKRLDELVALVPAWQRVSVFVQLVRRDESYYSRVLAGRVTRDEYVKTFRKLYDEARREKGDRDERDAKVEHVCKILATYVPDFESSAEWK